MNSFIANRAPIGIQIHVVVSSLRKSRKRSWKKSTLHLLFISYSCAWGESLGSGGFKKDTKISTEPGPWRDNWVGCRTHHFHQKFLMRWHNLRQILMAHSRRFVVTLTFPPECFLIFSPNDVCVRMCVCVRVCVNRFRFVSHWKHVSESPFVRTPTFSLDFLCVGGNLLRVYVCVLSFSLSCISGDLMVCN